MNIAHRNVLEVIRPLERVERNIRYFDYNDPAQERLPASRYTAKQIKAFKKHRYERQQRYYATLESLKEK